MGYCYNGRVECLCLKYLLSGPLRKSLLQTPEVEAAQSKVSSPTEVLPSSRVIEGRVQGGEGEHEGNIPAEIGDLIKNFASSHFRHKAVPSWRSH